MDAKTIVKEELEKIRAHNLQVASDNKFKALSLPQFRELDKQERALVIKIGKELSEDRPCDQLEKSLDQIKSKKEKALKSIGLKPEDLLPKFDCEICKDTGITQNGYCKCYNDRLYKILSSTEKTKEYTPLSKLKITKNAEQCESLTKIVDLLEKWANGKTQYKTVLLCGNTGVGKTTLAESTLGSFQELNKTVLNVSGFAMNELFTKYHTTFDETRNTYLSSLLDCDCLLIDDLGTEPLKKNITIEYLYLILSEREKNDKLTIITTNLDLEGILNHYGERIFSRLSSKQTTFKHFIKGTDLRLINK
ncbi:MAG: ATP-binding protein [Clostridia bacterium]|nr:ATP-binding protein [Clostridia bacterium]